jgi:DNA-binding GntR family transcriptional regulator
MVKRSYLSVVPASASQGTTEDQSARSLIEHAYLQLRDDIIDGALAPGEKLRIEHLKSRYGVGASTLREAITRLVPDALAVAESQRGFRVADIAVEDFLDLTELRVHIEIDALRRSIRCGDDAWRERVRRAYAELSEVEQPLLQDNRKRWEELNYRFHDALISGRPSPWATRVLRTLSRHSERYRKVCMELPVSLRDVRAEHRELFELALTGNEARAALALEAHIRTTPELVIRAIRSGQYQLRGKRYSSQDAP